MDATMVVFLVFLKYKKTNKIKSIEIIIKRTQLFKVIIVNLSKTKKSNQNQG
jgi:membrane protein CcdC involved in cytochrome C biogenesis